MQFPVGDAAAIALCHEFYQALAAGMPVDACVGEARKVIKVSGNELEWGTPVLFSRAADGRVLVLPEGDARPLIAPKVQHEPETVLVPGGAFTLGSAPGAGIPADETDAHKVDLPDYRIGKTPVTNAQYAAFLQQTPGQENIPQKSGWFLREPPAGKDDQPVAGVTWYDALAYCRWLSTQTGRRYRLPTEAEWEKAARSGRAEGIGVVQEWTQTLWGSDTNAPSFQYPYVGDDGRESVSINSRDVRVFRVYRGWRPEDKPDDARLPRRRTSEAKSALPWRGFRVVMELLASEGKA